MRGWTASLALVAASVVAATAEAGWVRPAHAETVEPVGCVADLDVATQAGQVLLALVDDPADAISVLTAGQATGIAPFGEVTTAEQETIDDLRSLPSPFGVLITSDEEGGRVQRYRQLLDRLPSAADQAATMSPAEVEEMYFDYGSRLAAFGVTMVFAPVVDVGRGPAIGDRSYSDDPAVVIDYATAAIVGYQRAGVVPVLKHFPGHGRASADTHNGPAVTPPLDDMRSSDLLPYLELLADDDAVSQRVAVDGVAVMVGHLDVPGLTNGAPASLSHEAITGLLRTELGFDGLVVSDALGMGAITDLTSGSGATVQFLRAGGDLAIVNVVDVPEIHAAIVAAVETGELERERLADATANVLVAKSFTTVCAAPEPSPSTTNATVTTWGARSIRAALGGALGAPTT